MNGLLIRPRDPLLFRDGRPFSSDPGARAKSQPFPLPSTIIGAIRTRAGLNQDGVWQPEKLPELLEYRLCGPLLIELCNTAPKTGHLLLTAPLDALMLDGQRIKVLHPLQLDADDTINLECAPVGLATVDPSDKSKPEGMPKYWYFLAFLEWLLEAKDRQTKPQDLGVAGLQIDTRTHVRLDPERQTADDGALFATSALDFVQATSGWSNSKHFGLYCEVSAPRQSSSLMYLGGESRFAAFENLEQGLLPAWGDLPVLQDIAKSILKTRACRVVLLTPAYFRHGWKPEFLLEPRFGVTPRLKAAVVGKSQTISGWDYALQKPKPTRRLAPAGSVYYLSLEGDDAAIATWLKQHWFTNISDEQAALTNISPFAARQDGFGLCAIGTWDGRLRPLEVRA
jgi:CRISPR-associated protein Cmr3